MLGRGTDESTRKSIYSQRFTICREAAGSSLGGLRLLKAIPLLSSECEEAKANGDSEPAIGAHISSIHSCHGGLRTLVILWQRADSTSFGKTKDAADEEEAKAHNKKLSGHTPLLRQLRFGRLLYLYDRRVNGSLPQARGLALGVLGGTILLVWHCV
jgi:hypothetical protein